jgi:hypothetical protein
LSSRATVRYYCTKPKSKKNKLPETFSAKNTATMAVEVAVMRTPHDAVSPVMYPPQNVWQPQPLSPSMDQGQFIHSPVGSVASPHSHGSPLSHAANSPVGVCSPTAVHSPHVQAHSPIMQAGSPLHCQQPLSVNVNIKQELPPADYGNCNHLTHLLRGGQPDFSGQFINGLNCHLVPPSQREILDGKLCVCIFAEAASSAHLFTILCNQRCVSYLSFPTIFLHQIL